jgi:hypothetical protein
MRGKSGHFSDGLVLALSIAVGREAPVNGCTAQSQGGYYAMKNSTRIAVSFLSIAALSLITACGSSTEQVKEKDTVATTYVPAPPPEVVVQPAPEVMVSPPTTTTTTEEKSASDYNDSGNNATEESSSSYHSQSSTVTPVEPLPPQESSTTVYQKKTYQETN